MSSRLWLLLLVAECLGCDSPPAVNNATVAISNHTTPSGVTVQLATYSCDESNGYIARGNTTIVCLTIHGYSIWSSVQFRCDRVECTATPRMAHGSTPLIERRLLSRLVQRYDYGRYYDSYGNSRYGDHYFLQTVYQTMIVNKTFYYNSHAQFTCAQNYFSSDGSRTVNLYCGVDGMWKPPDDICQGKDCGPLNEEGMNCTGNSTRFPTTKSCDCNKGYERNATSYHFSVTCSSSGVWTRPADNGIPFCTRVQCGAPPAVENSDSKATVTTGTVYEDRVTYKCLAGYELTSSYDTVYCQANRTWTSAPTCAAKNCGKPPEIRNGHTSWLVYNTTFRSEVKYSCDSLGYRIAGAPTIRCLADGTWTTPPICHRINCGPPPYVPNSERHVFGHLFNDTVRYECDVGYYGVGDEVVVCEYTGHWTLPPICKELSCEDPPEVENAKNSTIITGTTVGSEARYTCITGYVMVGESVIECLPNQRWSILPQCNRIRCGNPPHVPNGTRRVYGRYLNDATKYRCNTGYNLVGDVFIRCQPDGHWSIPPECHVITCEEPPAAGNAVVISFTGVKFGNAARYQCMPGYSTQDINYATCQLDGTWSRLPRCTATSDTSTAHAAMASPTAPARSTMAHTPIATTPAPTTAAAAVPTTAAAITPTTSTTTPTITATTAPTTTAAAVPTTAAATTPTTSATAAPTTSAPTAPTTSATATPTTSAPTAPTTSATATPTTAATTASTTTAAAVPSTTTLETTTVPKLTVHILPTFGLKVPQTSTKLPEPATQTVATTSSSPITSTFIPKPTEVEESIGDPSKEVVSMTVTNHLSTSTEKQLQKTTTPRPTLIDVSTRTSKSATQNVKYQIINVSSTSSIIQASQSITTASADTSTSKSSHAHNSSVKQSQIQSHKSTQSNVVIGCTFALVMAAILIIGAVFYFLKKRRSGEHNFIPVDNALYSADSQSMTAYSFKEIADSAE